MKIYSLSGPSGTGKSTLALQFAHEHKIEAIIDDGLLIVNGVKVAGTSAKFEKSAIKAVRRAIFTDDTHLQGVKDALVEHQVSSLLVIGTSDKMTTKIVTRLGREIDEYVHIETLRTPQEIKLAQFIRKTEGQHIMPIPMRQVEQNFFKRLIRRGFDIFTTKKEKIGETTIVQPDFHEQLQVVTKKDFHAVIERTLMQNRYVVHVMKTQFQLLPLPAVEATIEIGHLQYNTNMKEQFYNMQQQIEAAFNDEFSLSCAKIDLIVPIIHMEEQYGHSQRTL